MLNIKDAYLPNKKKIVAEIYRYIISVRVASYKNVDTANGCRGHISFNINMEADWEHSERPEIRV